MYARDTILTLKNQRPPDPETEEEFPYNRVRVIGESPVSHSHPGKWEGADAAGVIITPLSNFGGTLDEPFGKLRTLYDVESIPEPEVEAEQKVRIIDGTTAQAGKTPEEVFATEAPGTPPEPGQRRGRTSPLGEVVNEAADGPLGDATPVPGPEPVNPSPLGGNESPAPADPPEDEDPPVAERAPGPLDE